MKCLLFSSRYSVSAFCICLATVIFATMCKKANDSTSDTEPPKSFAPSCDDSCSECDATCYPKNVLEAISDDSDLPNHEMNLVLYHFAKALSKTMQDANARVGLYKVLRDKKDNISTSFTNLNEFGQDFEQQFKRAQQRFVYPD